MIKKLDFNSLPELAIIGVTSGSVVSMGIRIREAGLKNIFNGKICTHVGLIVSVQLRAGFPRILMIAEMLPDLEDKLHGLSIHPISRYLGGTNSHIVFIKSHPNFENMEIRMWVYDKIFTWWGAQRNEDAKPYDGTGCLKWGFPFLKDKKNAFYCSEMIQWLAVNNPVAPFSLKLGTKPDTDDIMPYDIQQNKNLRTIIQI